MSGTGPPTVLGQPVWYEPLRSPTWLLPKLDDGAPRVVLTPGEGDPAEPPEERELREGLPMFLADAVRYSTDARTVVEFAEPDREEAIRGVVDGAAGPGPVVHLHAPDGSDLGTVADAGVSTSRAGTIAALPGALVSALRPAGVRSVWSTVFQVPDEAHVEEQVRGYAVCRWLLDDDRHAEEEGDREATAARRAVVDAALRRLAELAGRTPNPFAAMLFFAGLAATHRAGNPVYLDHRLAANGICTTATDPLDPVFRMSVLVFRLLGDPVLAGQRARALGSVDDDDLRRWLARVDDVEPVG